MSHIKFGRGAIKMMWILCALHLAVRQIVQRKTILQMGGVVYGAAYDEQLAVSHIEVTDEAEREKLQSSKYVQSDPKDSYTKVNQRLSEGKTVLFTGTPCQIAGLYAFLGGNPENLYTVDLICHGVPSP